VDDADRGGRRDRRVDRGAPVAQHGSAGRRGIGMLGRDRAAAAGRGRRGGEQRGEDEWEARHRGCVTRTWRRGKRGARGLPAGSRVLGSRAVSTRRLSLRATVDLFREKDFYLEEFRGRSVLFAVAPSAVAVRPDLRPLATVVADLVRNDTRVMVWWPAGAPGSDRRLRGALLRAQRRGRRRRSFDRAPAVLRLNGAAEPARLRGELWTTLRRERLCVLVARAGEGAFAAAVGGVAAALRVPKLVLLDPDGGLLAAAPARLSFVDENVLATLLREGQAEWSGLGHRRALLVAVQDALRSGVEAVNLCTPEAVADELFTYVGSGTLFTRGDYVHVGPLGLDDFAQAERLLERGQREGLLKVRSPAEIALLLGAGYGARVGERHLAGVAALLTGGYAAERAGEIAGLYTITRFKGESIGERLVTRILAEAEQRGLAYVFACAVDERAMQFFARLGFARVEVDAVPAAKWVGYDARRRARVVVFKRGLAAA
jgi:amino-acid N-acetyltransferase